MDHGLLLLKRPHSAVPEKSKQWIEDDDASEASSKKELPIGCLPSKDVECIRDSIQDTLGSVKNTLNTDPFVEAL